MTRWGALVVIAIVAATGACAHEKRTAVVAPPPPKLAVPARPHHVAEAPPDWYWQPVFAEGEAAPIELPPSSDGIVRIEGASRVWTDLGDAGRERLRRDGIVVIPPPGPPVWRMGAFYTDMRARRIPHVITLDALFALAHAALTRALAEIETREIAPMIGAVLARMDARLAAEQKGSNVELVSGYRLARGVVAVARLLADERYVPSAELAGVVRDEKQRIDAHAGIATSPLLGVPIDYARFAGASPRPSYRVMTWLSAAPFALVAKTEAKGALVDVGTARHHARAAMLVARLADDVVDPTVHAAFARLGRFFTFVFGPPDDLTPLGLGDLAAGGGIDLAKPENIVNVVRVDKVRALARAARTPALSDGSGSGATMRLLGAHAPIDAVAVAQGRAATATTTSTTTDDFAAWLARPIVAESIHASIHGSLLDAINAWATSKGAPTKIAERARAESTLAAWTMARHVATSFGRTKPPAAAGARELEVSGAPLLALVEAEPESIARLLGTIGQARRGLVALGPLVKGSPADVLLAECEDLVKIALRVAEKCARDEALSAADTNALAAFPPRIAAFESDAADEGGPYAAVIQTDVSSGEALASASGGVEPAVLVVREPGAGRFVLALGAHVAHFEATSHVDAGEGAAAVLERAITDGKAARASSSDGFRLAR